MRKIIAPLIVILIGALYTGLWFYTAHHTKKLVVAQLDTLKQVHKNLNFNYDKVNISGFPLAIHVEILAPRAMLSDENSKPGDNDIHTEKVIITPNLWADTLTITTQGDLFYTYLEEKKPVTQYMHCSKNPLVTASFDGSLLTHKIATTTDAMNHLKDISYLDEGCSAVDSVTKTALTHSERTSFVLKTSTVADKKHCAISFDAKNIENGTAKDASADKYGKINLNGAATYSTNLTPPQKEGFNPFDLTIEKLNFSATPFSIGITGKVTATAEDTMFPGGEVRVQITKFENLVSDIADAAGLHNKAQIIALLRKASAKTDSQENIDVTIKSDKTGLTFGNVTLPEALSLYNDK
jgi:hypothetical protein